MSKIAIIPGAITVLTALLGPAKAAGPLVLDQLQSKWTVALDGTSVNETEFSIKVPKDQSSPIVNVPLLWSGAIESLSVTQVRIEKPGGQTVILGPDSVREDPPRGDALFHEYSDERRLIVTFTRTAAGDVLIVRTRREATRPRVPGGFFVAPVLDMPVSGDDVSYTVSVPTSLPFQFESRGFDHQSEVIIDRTVHYIHAIKTQAPPERLGALSAFDRKPRFAVSTFKDWEAFGAGYASLFAPHAKVTPAVRAMALEITKGQPETRDQARVLYEWVRDQIRHVPSRMARTKPDPNDAGQILTKRYGDDKDHAVVLTALLAARGIPADIVLLNDGNAATIASVPAIDPMDHVMVYLPGLDLYADSTRPGAPFGVLPFRDMGKPAIHLTGKLPARRVIPIADGGETQSELRTTAIFEADGTVTGTTTTMGRGAFGVWLREAAYAMGSETEAIAAATTLLRGHGTPGTGVFSPDPLTSARPEYRITGTFRIPNQENLLNGGYFSLWTGLRILPRAGDFLTGPMRSNDIGPADPTFCFPGSQREELSLDLPEGRVLATLPRDTDINTGLVHYSSQWLLLGRRVTVRRIYETRIKGPVCDGATRLELAELQRKVAGDMINAIGFERLPFVPPPAKKRFDD